MSLSKSAIVKTDGNVCGKIRSDLEDLAFLKRPQGKLSSRSKCLRKLKPVDFENTPLLPQQNQHSILRRLMGEKNRLKAERARLLSVGEESEA